jgi:hypothetical protein
MKRKQIYLDEQQEAAIKRLAARRGVSEAHVIREAMDEYLRAIPPPDAGNLFLSLAGIVDDPEAPVDGSQAYDRDLYGTPG